MPIRNDRWTVDLLDALPESSERFEIIDGQLYVTPSPGIPHQAVVLRLAARLLSYTDRSKGADTVISPSDVWREKREENRVQPDVYVVRMVDGGLPPYPFHLSELLLAVEVASPGRPFLDYDVKRRLYLTEGVREYWVINPEAKNLTCWRAASDPGEVLAGRVEWNLDGVGEPFVLDLPGFFDEALNVSCGSP